MLSILEKIPLSDYSTFRIGGEAKYLVHGISREIIQKAFQWAHDKQLNTLVIGKGSNTLFDSRGFNGLVIVNKLNKLTPIEKNTVTVESGFSFSLLGSRISRAGYSGLEFASGIPGSVGGAVAMNAGASGTDVASCIDRVIYIHTNGDASLVFKKDMDLGYRSSIFQKMRGCIISATFNLKQDSAAKKRQQSIIEYRHNTQPYNMPSCGCVFRNCESIATSKLIDDLNLKGLTVGGAQISTKHANFIVNLGKATSDDVLTLLKNVKERVFNARGIELMEELKYVPYDKAYES